MARVWVSPSECEVPSEWVSERKNSEGSISTQVIEAEAPRSTAGDCRMIARAEQRRRNIYRNNGKDYSYKRASRPLRVHRSISPIIIETLKRQPSLYWVERRSIVGFKFTSYASRTVPKDTTVLLRNIIRKEAQTTRRSLYRFFHW